jgi:DNA-binding beta-propeller fold protein YncE
MRRRLSIELLEDRRFLTGDIDLIRHFDTWDDDIIRSTDVAGIAYHSSSHLYLVDSEINEIPEIFTGDNIFETSLLGDEVFREIESGNIEPSGITYSAFDGYFYVTNDRGNHFITRYDGELDGPLLEVSTTDDGANDPEGITSDPSTGFLYLVDGANGARQVLAYDSDLVF